MLHDQSQEKLSAFNEAAINASKQVKFASGYLEQVLQLNIEKLTDDQIEKLYQALSLMNITMESIDSAMKILDKETMLTQISKGIC
jgi:hypothetical protein